MSENEAIPLNKPITTWVNEAKSDPVKYRTRCAVHILLVAIANTPGLQNNLILKGGSLMTLAYESPRNTSDVDFTVVSSPENFIEDFEDTLNPALRVAANTLGYINLVLMVQRIRKMPRPETFATATGAALKVTIGYADRGSRDEARLVLKQSTNALQLDLSFNEPMFKDNRLYLNSHDLNIRSYSKEDIIGEKLRALLQQPVRNRFRRQDVYDIAWLIDDHSDMSISKKLVLDALMGKSEARDIEPKMNSFDDPEIRRRAESQWNTLALEVASLPDFNTLFQKVKDFYVSLPWAS